MELLQIIVILLRRKWAAAGVFCLFVAVFGFGSFLVTPTYQTKAKLLVSGSDALSAILANLSMKGSSTISSDENIYETKLELARIHPLLEELINVLDLKNRKDETITPESLIEFSLLNRISPQPFLKIKQYDDTSVFKVVTTSASPKQAADMANTFAELYVAYSIQRTQKEYRSVKTSLEADLSKVRAQYEKSQAELKQFQIRSEITDFDIEKENVISRLSDLTTSWEDNNKLLKLLDLEISRTREKLSKISRFRTETKEYMMSSEVTTLRKKLNEMLLDLAAESAVYQKNHPEYKKLDTKITAIKKVIDQKKKIVLNRENISIDPVYDTLTSSLVSLAIDRDIAFAKKKILKQFIDRYKERNLLLPALQEENSRLELNLSVNKSMYEDLQTYLNQVSVAETLTLSDTRIIEHAVVPERVKFPKKGLNIILAVILGSFWAAVMAFFLEYIDTSVRSEKYISSLSGFLFLGSIARTRNIQNKKLFIALQPVSAEAEAFRAIKNQLQRLTPIDESAGTGRTILITSGLDGEGKTCTAANLAIAFAGDSTGSDRGTGVLVVDLNLRNPAQHTFFATVNTTGISNLLDHQVLSWTETVTPTTVSGLSLLSAGTSLANPGRLIDSRNMTRLIQELQRQYHTIIIDTPPCLPVSDAAVLAGMSDLSIMVVAYGKTTRSTLETAANILASAGTDQIGLLINKATKFRQNSIKFATPPL